MAAIRIKNSLWRNAFSKTMKVPNSKVFKFQKYSIDQPLANFFRPELPPQKKWIKFKTGFFEAAQNGMRIEITTIGLHSFWRGDWRCSTNRMVYFHLPQFTPFQPLFSTVYRCLLPFTAGNTLCHLNLLRFTDCSEIILKNIFDVFRDNGRTRRETNLSDALTRNSIHRTFTLWIQETFSL